MQQRDIMCRR